MKTYNITEQLLNEIFVHLSNDPAAKLVKSLQEQVQGQVEEQVEEPKKDNKK